MKPTPKGFTLTEILLVSAMFAVISLAVFNAFSNGFKLWARGQHVMVEEDMAIVLDRMADDLRSVVIITGIPVKGNSQELSFPAIIIAPADENSSRAKEGITSQIGAIRYTYDLGEKKILRSQATYGQALKSEWSEPVDVAAQVEDFSMRYYFKADRGVDVKSQTEEGVPLGIMLDLQFMVDGQIRHMRRFLLVPVGGGL